MARLCDVPAYVLRFWESEFPQLKPNKGGTGQRLYRRRDVEMALHIKRLLYDEGYTIPGARQVFNYAAEAEVARASSGIRERLARQSADRYPRAEAAQGVERDPEYALRACTCYSADGIALSSQAKAAGCAGAGT